MNPSILCAGTAPAFTWSMLIISLICLAAAIVVTIGGFLLIRAANCIQFVEIEEEEEEE